MPGPRPLRKPASRAKRRSPDPSRPLDLPLVPLGRRPRCLEFSGLILLERSASGAALTAYHLEAAIAACHVTASSAADTDWDRIVSLYGHLMDVAPSPVVALNRAIAIGERDGPDRGMDALLAIDAADRLSAYPFYPAAMGELGNADFAATLVALLDDSLTVRRAAVESLERIGGEDAQRHDPRGTESLDAQAARWKKWWQQRGSTSSAQAQDADSELISQGQRGSFR